MKFGYAILYVPDVAAALDFYTRAFGLPVRFLHESGTYGELETGATAIAFAQEDFVAETCHAFARTRPDRDAPAAELGLVSDDVARAYAAAVAAGAVPLVAPFDKPWGQTVSYVRDPNGFLVEICSPVG